MSLLYTTQIVSWQGLAAGDTLTVAVAIPSPGAVVRVDKVSFYWGNAFSAASVSAVVTMIVADDGAPTIATSNPSVAAPTPHQDIVDVRQCLPWLAYDSLTPVSILKVVNTSTGTNTVDVVISGVVLSGAQPASFTAAL